MSAGNRRPAGERNSVRIIGGRWRGKKIPFPDGDALRPTPSRLRETLFNWLMQDVRDARVLDLFSGSGALAFEALSRGARTALLVDAAPATCRQLQQVLASLAGADGAVQCTDALRFLQQRAAQPFDLVFLDPPFQRQLVAPACAALAANGYLREGSRVYVESEAPPQGLPANWQLHRQQQAGQVCCSLYIVGP